MKILKDLFDLLNDRGFSIYCNSCREAIDKVEIIPYQKELVCKYGGHRNSIAIDRDGNIIRI